MKTFWLKALVGVWLAAATLGSSPASCEIKLGILSRLGPVQMFTMFSPPAEYVTKQTGEKVSIVIPGF